MDKLKENDDDFLRSYINRGRIEKAPVEFTSETMTRIRLEAGSLSSAPVRTRKWFVPALSVLITISLAAAALLLIPSDGGNNFFSTLPDLIPEFSIVLPNPDIRFLHEINVPDWTVYGAACILILAFFDRALWGLFHREK